MRRGEKRTASGSGGDYGKSCPVVIIQASQADAFDYLSKITTVRKAGSRRIENGGKI